MTDYKRMVSYMYLYENGVKKKNVGYARVEAKNGQCKITLHMQLLGQSDSIFPTYLIHRENNRLELVYLGDSVLKAQVMDSRFTADEANIMGSGYGLSNMGGLLIFLNNNVFFATEWEDKPLVAEELLEAMKPKQKSTKNNIKQSGAEAADVKIMNTAKDDVNDEMPSAEETAVMAEAADIMEILNLEEELRLPKYKLPRGWKTVEMFQSAQELYDKDNEDKAAAAAIAEEIEVEAVPTEPIPERKDETKLTMDDSCNTGEQQNEEKIIGNTDSAIQESMDHFENSLEAYETDPTKQEEHPDIKYIFEHYPRIYPFEDNEVQLCVKLEPKDIGLLPKEFWVLSNNSFLTHGYYCYHHLIFAQMKTKDGMITVLGVPGIYHNREQFMARMFGFNCFKSIRKRDLRQGDFGYWYITVNF